MDGMQMMLKALGVNPDEIMKAAGSFQVGLAQVMNDLAVIKAQNEEILKCLKSSPEMASDSVISLISHKEVSNG